MSLFTSKVKKQKEEKVHTLVNALCDIMKKNELFYMFVRTFKVGRNPIFRQLHYWDQKIFFTFFRVILLDKYDVFIGPPLFRSEREEHSSSLQILFDQLLRYYAMNLFEAHNAIKDFQGKEKNFIKSHVGQLDKEKIMNMIREGKERERVERTFWNIHEAVASVGMQTFPKYTDYVLLKSAY